MAKPLAAIAALTGLAVLGGVLLYVGRTASSDAQPPTAPAPGGPPQPHATPLLSVPAPAPGGGRVFYVDTARGNDSYGGTSESAAFRTLGRALGGSGAPIAPGDTVVVRGGRYRERIVLTRGGDRSRRIVVMAAPGEAVVLDASRAIEGWAPSAGGAYRARPRAAVTAVVAEGVALTPEPSVAALREGTWHYDRSAGVLHVWMPRGGSPAGRDVGVIADEPYEDGILVNAAGHVTFSGLTVRYAGGHGISILGDGVRVERCTLEFNGKAGVNVFGESGTRSDGVQIVGNDIHWNVMRNWPRGRYKWGGWAMGAVSNGTPNLLYEGNVSHHNGGEGLGAYTGPGGSVFRGNVAYDNWSVNIYVDHQPDAVVERNLVYSHEPDPLDLRNNGDDQPGDGRNLRRLRPIGILTGDEKYDFAPRATLGGVLIANNVIVNCRRGIDHYPAAAGSGLKHVRVLHNTIVVPAAAGPGEDYVGISVPYSDGNNEGAVYLNNLVVARHPGSYLLYSDAPPGKDSFAGLRMESNLWHHAGRTDGFHWGPDGSGRHDFTHAQWVALAGAAHGQGDVLADPRLADPGGLDALGQRPLGGSPAIDRGIESGIALDFSGHARPVNGRPDMGAFEAGGGPPAGR